MPLTASAAPVTGLEVSIGALAAVDGTGNGVGEVSGPALSFMVSAVNGTDAPIDLTSAVVGLSYGAALTPADELTSASTPLPGAVNPGETVTGTYVFTIPADQRSAVQISVDYRAGTPVVVFAGSAP